ncbi:uncharacterized protein K489DRAFT_197056 [Dissoconium aciculare CBS 342.82]|uniref:Uncharacterized protein n=1 Tax=Dissoconium aciculare CBS 342.82 TaxID=1314786 RepID=A0A6J3M6F6_9PEZI|nr:uncharacterized protein K489DRAFT_197056 [Dissoconium aciculare CBS 342.82]KAF1823483.1 hypothetical protein K489DRAFT_197056 [Dissoconium aciculare CBS 342.82]
MALENGRNTVQLTPDLRFGQRERLAIDDPGKPMNVYYYRRFSIVWEFLLIPATAFAASWCSSENYGTPLIAGLWSLVSFEIVFFGLVMPIMTWDSDEIDQNGSEVKTRRPIVGWVSRELVLEAERCVDGCYDGRSSMRDPRFGDGFRYKYALIRLSDAVELLGFVGKDRCM